jgi:uncharacterized membrane protein
MGRERTIEQDSTFAFRIMVDIAIKALSPAINDPTTAVLAIDQLHRLLVAVGRRYLHDDVVRDAAGQRASSSGHPTGKIMCTCLAARSDCTAPRTIRSANICGR